MKKGHLLFSLLLTLSLLGCSARSNVTAIKNNTIKQDVCCANYSQFKWIPLNGSHLDIIIDADSPIARFDNEKSYFSAFVIPQHIKKLHIDLSSLMSSQGVFAPYILLLDKKFNPVKRYSLSDFNVKNASVFHLARYQKQFIIEQNVTPYLIVYSPEKYRKGAINIPHPERLRANMLGMDNPKVTDPVIPHRNFGALRLDLQPLHFRAYTLDEMTPPFSLSEKANAVTKKAKIQNMMLESEAFYNKKITDAIQKNDIELALKWLDEAKRAGSSTAQKAFITSIIQ